MEPPNHRRRCGTALPLTPGSRIPQQVEPRRRCNRFPLKGGAGIACGCGAETDDGGYGRPGPFTRERRRNVPDII
ncbi:hypothetical protein GCM10027570_03210 [Streptomonospora sediminis]